MSQAASESNYPQQPLNRWFEDLATLIQLSNQSAFPDAMLQALARLIPSDDLSMVWFDPHPQLLSNLVIGCQHSEAATAANTSATRSKQASNGMTGYLAGAFLLDPYYRAGKEQRLSGFAPYTALVPSGFNESEYYKRYLGGEGFIDECGFVVQFDDNSFINVSLDRSERFEKFNPQELELLRAIAPLIDQLCQNYWQQFRQQHQSQPTHLPQQLDQALQCFGSSKLTAREAQIIRLVLQGHSSLSLAEKLGISEQTVRLHRSNAYQKLDIGGLAELFHLFISSLKHLDDYQGGDPLAGYF